MKISSIHLVLAGILLAASTPAGAVRICDPSACDCSTDLDCTPGDVCHAGLDCEGGHAGICGPRGPMVCAESSPTLSPGASVILAGLVLTEGWILIARHRQGAGYHAADRRR
ncbi:MAG TPA: hypothetical protein VE404_08245 [Verrucomicrobiae bacterium]|nr:hypothetical protein [Verrucomicrobiae bacterium]